MKILLYESESSSSGISYPIKNSLEEFGHEVDVFDFGNFLINEYTENIALKIFNKLTPSIFTARLNNALCNIISHVNYDAMFVMMGKHILPSTLELAKEKIKLLINWNTDCPFNMLSSSQYVLDSYRLYDFQFTPRIHMMDAYKSLGGKSIHSIEWYYRPGQIFSQDKLKNISFDEMTSVSFVGSRSNRRNKILSRLFIKDSKVFGWGWKKHEPNSEWIHGKHISIIKMMDLFSKSKINLNILTAENNDVSNFRNYEIPAAFGFQISERSNHLMEIFDEDKEIVFFSSQDELNSKVSYYLKNDSARKKIALKSNEMLIKKDCSLNNRIKRILNIVNS